LPTLDGERRVAVAVVGAGFTGLSTALHLAEAGVREVVVLEAARVGHGASGRNNGQVIPTLSRADPDAFVRHLGEDRGTRFAHLVRDSASFLFDLVRRHGIDCDAVQKGWVQPAHRPSRLALSEKRVRLWQKFGADVDLLDKTQTAEILGTDTYFGGWQAPTGGHVNPLGLARGLAKAAVAAGATVFEQSPVTSMVRTGDHWRLTTPGGAVLADQVVLATAGYTGGAFGKLRASFLPYRSYQCATAPVDGQTRSVVLRHDHAMSDTRGDLRFAHYDRDGRLVVGGALVLYHDDAARIRKQVRSKLAETFPALRDPVVETVWHGQFALSKDGLPHLFEAGPGVWGWIGCNGRGVALSVSMGPVLAALVQGQPPAAAPLPVEGLEPIPARPAAALLARVMIALYRRADRRD
jgi:glycine/D-amino acid oxidase-like deaminating enzyme